MIAKVRVLSQNSQADLGEGLLNRNSALLFDLGGTHLRCACLTERGEIGNIKRERIQSFRDGVSPTEIWSGLLTKIEAYTTASEALVGKSAPLVISFPGPLYDDGRIVNAPTVTGKNSEIPDLCAELSKRTGRVVRILNDVSAAALYLAKDSDWDRLMVITVSSGIGSKVNVRNSDHSALFDRGPYAGEIGHLIVDESEDAPRCDCGGKGHLGGISSGRGVEDLARRRAAADSTDFSRSLCHRKFGATSKTLNNEEHLVPAVRDGDEWALRVLEDATKPLAIVLNTVVLALGLQGVLVIGGFALALGDVYLEVLRKTIQTRSDYSALVFSSDMVRFGKMCDDACLRGAAEYAIMTRNGRL